MKVPRGLATATFALSIISGTIAKAEDQKNLRDLPKACQTVAETDKMSNMMGSSPSMQNSMNHQKMNNQMTETQKGLHQAMMKMQPEMMQGMMAKDADLAWICTMIPHHAGAIEMAKAGLKGAENPESKRLAEETIKTNERDLRKLVEWVNKYGAREERKKPAGSSQK